MSAEEGRWNELEDERSFRAHTSTVYNLSLLLGATVELMHQVFYYI